MPVLRSQGVLAPDGRIFGVPYGAAQVRPCCFRMGAEGLGLGSSIYIPFGRVSEVPYQFYIPGLKKKWVGKSLIGILHERRQATSVAWILLGHSWDDMLFFWVAELKKGLSCWSPRPASWNMDAKVINPTVWWSFMRIAAIHWPISLQSFVRC